MEKVTVSAAALRRVLNALNGPGHYIRELQVTRGPLIGDDNPINILCDEYNAAVKAHNEARKVGAGRTADECPAPSCDECPERGDCTAEENAREPEEGHNAALRGAEGVPLESTVMQED